MYQMEILVGTEKYEYKKDWYNSFIKKVKNINRK